MPAKISLTQRQQEQLRLAHNAMMVDDATKMLAFNRQQNLAHSRMVADMPLVPEEDVSFHIGDKYEQIPAPASSGALTKVLAGAAIGAGLLTTGGIAGLGAAAIMRPATPPPATVAPAPIVLPAPVAPQPMEFDEVEQRLQPDGTWIATGRTVRKRLLPDGTTQTRGDDGFWK